MIQRQGCALWHETLPRLARGKISCDRDVPREIRAGDVKKYYSNFDVALVIDVS